MEGVPNFKFRSRDPDHAHFRGNLLSGWKILVMLHMPAKYEVSMLNRSIDIEGVPKYPCLLTKCALGMRGIT